MSSTANTSGARTPRVAVAVTAADERLTLVLDEQFEVIERYHDEV